MLGEGTSVRPQGLGVPCAADSVSEGTGLVSAGFSFPDINASAVQTALLSPSILSVPASETPPALVIYNLLLQKFSRALPGFSL